MPTPTYDLIAEQTVTGIAGAASITFSSIPQTYKDLVLEMSVLQSTGSSQQSRVQLNGDTGTNYSITYLDGNGSAASSGRLTSETSSAAYYVPSTGTASPIMSVLQFMSYSSGNVYKTWLTRTAPAAAYVSVYVHLWRSTAAITSITITTAGGSGGNLLSGCTFRLSGIAG